MKKQLLIAAVAATMASAAMADISISGACKVNYTTLMTNCSTNDSTQELNLKFVVSLAILQLYELAMMTSAYTAAMLSEDLCYNYNW